MTPPLGDIAHIGHAQLFTPDLDAGVAFFTDFLGFTVNGEDGDTVRLRTFDDYEHHSLVLTARARPGLGRLALRTSGEDALRRRVGAIEAAGGSGTGPRTNPASASSTSPPTPTATNTPCTGRASTTGPPSTCGPR